MELPYRGFVYVLEGSLDCDGEVLEKKEAFFFDDVPHFEGRGRFVLIAGGETGEPIIQNGPFVD